MSFSERCVNLSGTTRLSIGVVPELQFERTDTFSVSAWFRSTTAISAAVIITNLDNTTQYRGWEVILSSGVLRFNLVNNATSGDRLTVDSVSLVNDDLWHHAVVTYDGSSAASGVLIYIDGYEVDTTAPFDALTSTTVSAAEARMGLGNDGGAPFAGRLDDIAVYDVALSRTEVVALRGRGHPVDHTAVGPTASLIGYWRLGDDTTPFNFPVFPDSSASGNDATLVSGSSANLDPNTSPDDSVTEPMHVLDNDTFFLMPFTEREDLNLATTFVRLEEAWRRYPLTASSVNNTPFPMGGPRQSLGLGKDYSIWCDEQEGDTRAFTGAGDSAVPTALNGPAWTVELWVYVHRTNHSHTLVQWSTPIDDTTESRNYLMRLTVGTDETLRMFWEHDVGVNETVVSTSTITPRQWTHVAAVCVENGANRDVTFYFNGVPDATITGTPKATGGTVAFWSIGQDEPGQTPAWCAMAYIRVSSIARTPTEISNESSNPGSIYNDADTLAYWDCQKPAVHADLSRNGNHGTHYNFTTSGATSAFQEWGVDAELTNRSCRRVFSSTFSGVLGPRRQDLTDILVGDAEFTYECWINILGNTGQSHVLFRVGGNSSDVTQDGNHQVVLQLPSSGEIRVFWEHSASVLVDLQTSAPWYTTDSETYSWHHFAMRKRSVGVGSCEIDFFLDGQFFETVGPAQVADVGDIYTPSIVYVFHIHDVQSNHRGEARLSSVARSNSEILESYENGVVNVTDGGFTGIAPKRLMRARNAADDAYVSWVVEGDPDFNGLEAPEAIDTGSAVLTASWDIPNFITETLDNVPYIQTTNVPVTATDPGIGQVVVLVDTASVSWSASDVITLPATPQTSARVLVKDATGSADLKPIVVNGNGETIEGDATEVLSVSYISKTYLYDGTEWKVI